MTYENGQRPAAVVPNAQAVCHDSTPFGLTVFWVIVHTTVPLSSPTATLRRLPCSPISRKRARSASHFYSNCGPRGTSMPLPTPG